CLGFSTIPTNPSIPGGERIGPFYTFETGRLAISPNAPAPPNPGPPSARFFSFLDRYGTQPYAYFSSYKTTNGYNRYGTSDCLYLGVTPYAETPNRYHKADSFQIISAGVDGKWGAGSGVPPTLFWTPASASVFYPDGTPGRDDQGSFYSSPLGVENK